MSAQIDTSTTAGKIAVMQAFADGNRIEIREVGPSATKWETLLKGSPYWNWANYSYRIAPEPKTRQLRASDWDGLPVVWVRSVKEPMSHWLVTGVTEKGFMYAGLARSWVVSDTEYLLWSTDRKTWKQFTVEDKE